MSEEKKLDFYINKYITYYKNNFSKIWEDENFKWKAIKCFQDNWDINAKDFLKMLDNSFAQTYNLLSSNQYFPLKMIKLYANYDCQKVRAMFLDLYNEDKDIIERISNFKKSSEDLCNMYTPGYQHYQKENAITVYLWLKNPDKYYIFKFGEIKSVAEKLHSEYDFRKGAYENNIRNHIKLYDLICNILQDDFELKKIFYSHLDETCYQDPYMKTLTIDFGYYVANIDSKIAIENIEVNNKLQSKNYPQLKNQILYGPPGTGKTYNTVIKAIEITNPELIQKDKDGNVENYEVLKGKFDELRQKGQIEFVTFHQSYSYEEFVEGIKPDLESNDLKYKLDSGVFKRICQNAAKTMTDNFDEVYEKFINDLADYNEDNLFQLKTGKGKTFGITVNSNKNLSIYMGKNLTKWGTLTKENLKNLSDWQYYANPIYTYLKNNYNLVVTETENSIQPYILIIDEINRGNISKIFGELITLIEEDKRGTLSVKLPYSQEDFTVPQNLYIIGTMNTSDRSIASIDIALRRRFKFVEMMPRPEKLVDKNNQPLMVEDINLQNLLKTINERISYILDRDHQIGHSYFMNWKNYDMTTLKNVWFDEIIPLLNEYFYSDWDKLQAILGQANEIGAEKSFIVKIKKPNLPYEADCNDEEVYYNFVKKEDVNETDFRTMLKNAQLIESKSNVTSKAD